MSTDDDKSPRSVSPLDALHAAKYRRGSLYEHAFWYDVDYQGYRAELPFYERLAKSRGADDVFLEVGAGTGRIAIPIALSGRRVHAVEPSPDMRRTLGEHVVRHRVESRVSVEDAFAHNFVGPTDGPVGVVAFPFNGLLHLHERSALDAFLEHARAILLPGGLVSLDVTGPCWEEMGALGRAWGRLDSRVHPSTGQTVWTMDHSLYDESRRSMRTYFRYLVEGEREGIEAFIDQFMWTAQELLHALKRHGFVVVMAFGDVDFSPLVESSPRIMLGAERR